ncbi:efflux RND transporter permease subunit [uncultured Brachyspira sp.]|uniref:efflux RND transporter permease subunit n=1 Tax=uncultured Brachyspira sp. TaxID=221953 RepID=UPI002617840B|nr:efflux RND transporter permease subunit [uncultured Brachyspira sp.]
MRSFIELIVKRPVAVFMGIVAVIILGAVSLSRLPVDFLPDMELPYISIRTTYDNAGPEEVEKSVSKIIEGAVSSVNNIKEVSSSSEEEDSRVFVEFNWGSDLASATADIREAIDRIRKSLPDDAESPAVYKFSTDNIPIMEVSFYGTENLSALYNLVDNQVLTSIEQVGGVAMAEIRGGLKTQVKVDVDMNRLQAYGLDINSIVNTLALENQNISGGETYEGVYKYTLRTTGEFKNVNDIGNVVVALKTNSTPIRLRELATIYEGYDEDGDVIKVNGTPAVTVSINKESGANTVAVSDGIKKRLDTLNLPEGIKYEVLFNSADNVNKAIKGVLDTAWQGGLFAVIILMLYLWNVRTVLIIAISIPMSIIVTFTLMYFFGTTLNIISLSGLVLGIGMMVDNSIVVLENIFFYRNNGYGKYSSAIDGTSTVALAISASTLTTIAVFLPFLFVEGQTGQMFRDLCITVTVSMIASLAVALTIVPMLGARLVTTKKSKHLIKFENFFDKHFHSKVNYVYEKVLTYSVGHKNRVLIPVICVVVSVIVVGVIFIGKEGFPESDEGQFRAQITMPVGTRKEQTSSFVDRMRKDVEEVVGKDLSRVQTRARSGSDANRGEIRAQLIDKSQGRKLETEEYVELVRKRLASYPATINVDSVTSMKGGGNSDSSGIDIDIVGEDLTRARELANNIITALQDVPGLRDVRLKKSDASPELNVTINRDLASKMGLNINTVANSIKTSFGGTTATRMTPENSDVTDIDVIVRLNERDRINIDDVKRMLIPTTAGMVPVSAVANVDKTFAPSEINRKNDSRITSITASGYGRPMNQIVEDIQAVINEKVFIPSGFTIIYSGDYEDMQEAFGQLIQALLLALVLVYAIMASQFESYIAPFVIALAIPFGFAGSLTLLLITGQTLSVYSGIGVIVLIGIVVNNGIVLIDYMNQLMHEKKINGDAAALLAGPRRLRPVLMTSLTTILGLLPMALSGGEGNEMYQPLSLAVLGGLTVSTMFTLVIVPTVYAAIRNRIPLKDYEAKDIESRETAGIDDALSTPGK